MPIDVATGAVHFDVEDIRIPGRYPLVWGRRYHSGLKDTESDFGSGWTGPYFSRLTRIDGNYRFQGPDGFISLFPDSEETVPRTGVVRDLARFQEIERQGRFLRVTKWDSDGNITRFFFQPERNGQWWPLRAIEDDKGNGLDFAWDGQGRLNGIRQRHEKRTLAVAYTATGRIATVSYRYPDGRHQVLARYDYDAKSRLVSAMDAMGGSDRYEYGADGNLMREVAKDGGVFSYKYDDKGRCVRSHGLENYDLKILRYLDTAGMTEMSDSVGGKTLHQWLASGQVYLSIDPMGGRHETEYDEFGRILSKTDPLGNKTSYEYDPEGNRCKLIDASGNAGEFKYNGRHQAIAYNGADGLGWKKEYDDFGRPVRAEDALGNVSSIEYDAAGNPILLKRADGAVSRRWYSERGNLAGMTDWAGNRTDFEHDDFGRVVRRTDPNGYQSIRKYDPLGRVIESVSQDGKAVKYRYDAGGNVVSVESTAEPGAYFKYGPCRRLLEKKFGAGLSRRYTWGSEPDRLEAVENEIGETYRFNYDAAGRVSSEIGFDGRATTFKYDLAGRCVGRKNGLGQSVTLDLDPMGRVLAEKVDGGPANAFGYDAAGRMASAENSWSAIKFKRDGNGRILEEDQNGVILTRRFSQAGDLLELDSGMGARFRYEYDANGLVAAIDANGLGTFRYGRNGAGLAMRLDLPHGLRLENEYDSRARLVRQTVLPESVESAAGSVALVERKYRYNAANMLVSVEDGRWGESAYAYDENHRLTAHRNGPDTTRYLLNPVGDPTAILREGSAVIGREYGPGGALIRQGGTEFEYDGAGRLVVKTERTGTGTAVWRFAWDAKDRLLSVRTPEGGTWEYQYDPFGRRCLKKGPDREIRFVWNHDVLLHEMETGRATRTWGFENAGFKPLFKIQEGRLHSFVTDHLGTPREILDDSSKIIWSATFDPLGNPISGTGNLENCPFRFQGQYFDPESGLHYNRFRYYDPASGRYISRDPILLAGGISAYQYAPNPIQTCDPLGLCEETLYRTMSQEDFDELQRTGRMPATTETTTSPTQSFSEDYDGVLVEFKLQPGTISELEAIGVRDDGRLTRERYPDMPIGRSGWNEEHARFKQEGDQINIALGKGDALDIFNDNITGFNVIRP